MKLISNISTYSDHRRKGTIGENVECISRLWNCSYDYLCENTASTVDIETSDRVRAIKELTACKDNGDHLPIFDSSELSDLIGKIACYQILLNCDIKYAYCLKDKWIRTLVTLCTALIWCMCIVIFWHILHLYLYHFIIVPRVRNKHIIYIDILIPNACSVVSRRSVGCKVTNDLIEYSRIAYFDG